MGKIRSLKPDWLDDELLVEAGSDARTLSVALILLADDFGNGRAGRLWLAARVFPGLSVDRSEEAFAALVRVRFIAGYDVDGQRYYSIRSWDKHQRLDKRARSSIPMPPSDAHQTAQNITPGNPPENPGAPGASPDLPGLARVLSTVDEGGEDLGSRDSAPSLLSGDQPESLGSARVGGRARSKPRTDPADLVPFLMHDAWEPDAEQVAALALKFTAPEASIRGLLPEFRWFWKQNGKRVAKRAWGQTFGNRVAEEAKRGTLYATTRPAERVSVEPSTICPLDLVARLEASGAVMDMAAALFEPRESVVDCLREFVGYWTIGKGMGKTRQDWPGLAREWVRQKSEKKELRPVGAIEHDRTESTLPYHQPARRRRESGPMVSPKEAGALAAAALEAMK